MKPAAKQSPLGGATRIDQDAIGARLREMFDEVVKEPVPDDFLELLRRAGERHPTGGPDVDAG